MSLWRTDLEASAVAHDLRLENARRAFGVPVRELASRRLTLLRIGGSTPAGTTAAPDPDPVTSPTPPAVPASPRADATSPRRAPRAHPPPRSPMSAGAVPPVPPLPARERLAVPVPEAVRRRHDPERLAVEGCGRFEVLAALGESVRHQCFKVYDRRRDEVAVLKVVRRERRDDPRLVARLRWEARMLLRAPSSRLVRFLAVDEVDGRACLQLAYLPGPSLEHRLARGERPATADAVAIALDALAALAPFHRRGLVHGAVDPSKLVGRADGPTFLLGTGHVQTAGATPVLAHRNLAEAAGHLAPEVVREAAVVPATDVYAVGCVLFRLLSGHEPFPGETPLQRLQAHLEGPVPDPDALAPGLPPALGAAVRRSLSRHPADRHVHAAAFARALGASVAGPAERPFSAPAINPSHGPRLPSPGHPGVENGHSTGPRDGAAARTRSGRVP